MEYEADGSFWLADPDQAVRGRLRFTQEDGGDLRLEGILAGPKGGVMPDADVMHGTAIDGTALALINAFPVNLQIVSPKPSYPHRFFVNRLLIGTHDADQVFGRLRVVISDLLAFTASSGLSITQGGSGLQPDEKVEISWDPMPEMPKVKVEGDEVEFVAEHNFQGDEYEFCLEHRVEVELRGSPRPLLEWHAVSGAVVGFLCFFLGYPTKPERLYAPLEDHEVEEVFQHRDGGSGPKRGGPWITLDLIEDEFDEALRGWFAFAQSDPGAFELLSEYLRFPGRLLNQDRLLYLARIIELYYRGGDRFVQTLKPKEEHKARKKAVVEAVPECDREWVAKSLARSNEKTLRERVYELVESFGDVLFPLFEDLGEFAAGATDNRNYYTHYSERTREAGRVVEGIELHELVTRLLFLVRACLLREMGFGDEQIKVLLGRDRTFAALAQEP
jgi:ApeA N-terminal domain 1